MRNDSETISGKCLPPIFIMGCQRSGTSLLAFVLNNHSRIAVYLETHYYPIFRPNLHCYGDMGKSSNLLCLITNLLEIIRSQGVRPPELDEFLEALVVPTFEGVLSTLLHLYARQQGKVQGCDKTPEHYAYLSEILVKLPDSPVIFLIRDPRDTVFSIRKAFGTSLKRATWKWNEAFFSYQQASRPVHLIRYEELVQKPAEMIGAMCTFLGEPYEPAMLRFFERVPERFRTNPHARKLYGPVDAGSVGNFRQMPSHEIEQIEAACAAGMEAMGYPFTVLRRNVMSVTAPKKLNLLNYMLDLLRFYYRGNRMRWQRGWAHLKMVLRVRTRYLMMLGPFRKNW